MVVRRIFSHSRLIHELLRVRKAHNDVDAEHRDEGEVLPELGIRTEEAEEGVVVEEYAQPLLVLHRLHDHVGLHHQVGELGFAALTDHVIVEFLLQVLGQHVAEWEFREECLYKLPITEDFY